MLFSCTYSILSISSFSQYSNFASGIFLDKIQYVVSKSEVRFVRAGQDCELCENPGIDDEVFPFHANVRVFNVHKRGVCQVNLM